MFQDAEDATEDPEPIMVTGKDKDDVISAILDKHIGVGCIGWGRAMEQRCENSSGPSLLGKDMRIRMNESSVS